MPVYNGERFLSDAIESILDQTFTDFELIVVDDGSQDASAAIVRAYRQRDQRLRLLQLERNMGRCDARNAGIAAAAGRYIAAMDADDFSLPRRMEMQTHFLLSHPEIGVVGSCGQGMNHDMSEPLHDFEVPAQHALIALYTFLRYGILGASLMFRRECLTQVGGYENGRRFCDDLELHWRMLRDTSIRP